MNIFGRPYSASTLALFVAMLVAAPAWSTPVLTLLPSASIGGLPGEQIGWGFSITNDADYIEITGAQFCLDPVSFPACTTPIQGTFTDFISQFNGIIVGNPGGTLPDTVSQVFDALLLTGVGSFDIAAGAPIYSTDVGQIVLTYNVYDADPDVDGANQLFSDQLLVANAAALVTDQLPVESVPEPSSLLLASGGILALLASLKRR